MRDPGSSARLDQVERLRIRRGGSRDCLQHRCGWRFRPTPRWRAAARGAPHTAARGFAEMRTPEILRKLAEVPVIYPRIRLSRSRTTSESATIIDSSSTASLTSLKARSRRGLKSRYWSTESAMNRSRWAAASRHNTSRSVANHAVAQRPLARWRARQCLRATSAADGRGCPLRGRTLSKAAAFRVRSQAARHRRRSMGPRNLERPIRRDRLRQRPVPPTTRRQAPPAPTRGQRPVAG